MDVLADAQAALDRVASELRALGVSVGFTIIYDVRDGEGGAVYFTNELEDALREGRTLAALRGPRHAG